MDKSDSRRFGILVNALASQFRQEASEALLHGYWLGLKDLPIEAVEEAVEAAIRECEFMPPAAKLRALVGGMKDTDRALIAWAKFDEAVTTHGSYVSVTFDDPLINAAVRMLGGWEKCCGMTVEQFDVWLRKDFLKTYETLMRTGAEPALCLPLGGYCDRQNSAGGFAGQVRQPTLIETGLPPHRPGIIGAQAHPAIETNAHTADLTANIGLERK